MMSWCNVIQVHLYVTVTQNNTGFRKRGFFLSKSIHANLKKENESKELSGNFPLVPFDTMEEMPASNLVRWVFLV